MKDTCPSEEILKLYRSLGGEIITTGSDAHYLDQIADASQYLYLPEWTPRAVLDWLLYGGE